MRRAFAETLVELAGRDRRIVLLTGDLGFGVLEPFQQRYPDRFFNAGVAEQNMAGIATGLASAGFIPFIYSITPFAVLRPYEFIRNGAVLHRLPVRIAGIGVGFEYGHNGLSHYALEDVGVLRLQPGLTVVCPADDAQTRSSVRATYDLPGPVYYRLSKDETGPIDGIGSGVLDEVQQIGDGGDLLIVSMGAITRTVLRARDALAARGIRATVAVVLCAAPAPAAALVRLLTRFKHVMTVEDHYVTGGLGSLVAEVIADNGLACRLTRRGVVRAGAETGSAEFMRNTHGLSVDAIVAAAVEQMNAAPA